MVMAGTMLLAVMFSFIMLLFDQLYAIIDPRIKAKYCGEAKLMIHTQTLDASHAADALKFKRQNQFQGNLLALLQKQARFGGLVVTLFIILLAFSREQIKP